MNEIKLLETYGPDGPALSDGARQVARSRLRTEMTTAMAPEGRRAVPVSRRVASGLLRLPPGMRMALGAAAAVAAVLGAVAVLPQAREESPFPPVTAGTDSPAARPVNLVAATTPEFPYDLPMLGTPIFTADPGGPIMAVYQSEDQESDVVLVAFAGGVEPEDFGHLGRRPVSVDGRPGRLVPIDGAHQLTWERRPGQWVTIVGNGRYDSEEAVLGLARQVVDQPQEVGIKVAIGLVPDGWDLGGFKENTTIVTYVDPQDPASALTVRWTPLPDWHPDSEVMDFEAGQDVTVNERHARLVRARDFWMLTTTLADGSGFTLMAPRSFSADQVIAVAGSVRLNQS